MSREYQASLIYGIKLSGDELSRAINCVDEEFRDAAWEEVSELCSYTNQEDSIDGQDVFLGHVIFGGNGDTIGQRELGSRLDQLDESKEKVLRQVESAAKDRHIADPSFIAFIDWLYGELVKGTWQITIIPEFG